MKRRKWKPEQKALIVLEGLRGRPIGEHEISQTQYYQWRDQFLANAAKASQDARPRARPGAQKNRRDPGMRRGPYAKVAARNAACSSGSGRSRPSIRSGATAGSGPICATSTAWWSTRSGTTAS
jgi:transposase-like protein